MDRATASSTSRRAFLRGLVLAGGGLLSAVACAPAATPAPTAAPTAAAKPTTAPAAAASPQVAASPVASPAAAASPVVVASPVAAASPAAAASPVAAPGVTGPKVNVRGAWVAQTANQMIWPLAKDAGYFDKYGINFDLSYVNGSNVAIAALNKDIDVASVAGSAVVGAQASGQDVVMVAGFLNQAVFRIMGMQDMKTIDDVKGKTVAVTRIGNADYFTWQTLIQDKKWGPDDIKFVNGTDVAGQVALLQQGAVQAIAVSPPNDVLALKVGAHMVLDTATLNEPEQNVGFAAPRAYLTANRATCLNIIKASVEAMARWKKDEAFTKGVIQKYLKSDDPQFTDIGYSAYAPVWPQAPYPSRDGMAKVIEEVSAQNPKAKDLSLDKLIDASLVKELEDSGFIKQIYG